MLRGASATIQNIILDKDYYQAGDTAQLSFMWSPSADSFPESRAGSGTAIPTVSLTATIVDADQKSCAEALNQILSQDFRKTIIEIPVSITASCMNPHALLVLKDGQGNVLAEENFIIESTSVQKTTATSSIPKTTTVLLIKIIVGIFALLILAGIAFYLYKVKKNKNETHIQ